MSRVTLKLISPFSPSTSHPAKPAPLRNCTLRPFLQTYLLASGSNSSAPPPPQLAMAYPTAMATAPLGNQAYVNTDGVSASAARAAITRNGLGGVQGRSATNKNKGHKTKTKGRERRQVADWEDSPADEHDEEAAPPPPEVPQLSVSRRHSSRGSSRLARVINKTNLGGPGISPTSGSSPTDNDHHIHRDAADNNEDYEEEEDVKETLGKSGRTTSRTSSSPPPARNPKTTTTRRMNVNKDENREANDEPSEEQEEEDVEDDDGVALNGLPKYSFLRGEISSSHTRSPSSVQYDSAIINNNNNRGNRGTREGEPATAGLSGELGGGVASASTTTPTAMELECVAGYDGGLPQFFVLEAYDSRTRRLRLNITSAFPDLPLFRIDMDGES